MTGKLNTAKLEDKAMSRIVPKFCGEGIKLEDTIKYGVTNECVSFFNTNGAIIKNQNLMLLQIFNCIDIQQSQLEQYLTEIDMEFIWSFTRTIIIDAEDTDVVVEVCFIANRI